MKTKLWTLPQLLKFQEKEPGFITVKAVCKIKDDNNPQQYTILYHLLTDIEEDIALDDFNLIDSGRLTDRDREALEEQHQGKVIIDIVTGNLLRQVYKALSEENKKKFLSFPLLFLVDRCWKLVK